MKRGFLKTAKQRPLGPSVAATLGVSSPDAAASDTPAPPMEYRRMPYEKLDRKIELPDEPKREFLKMIPGEDQPYSIRYTRVPPYETNVEPTTECMFKTGTKEMLYSDPNFPNPLPPQPSPPAFRVAPSPGKGIGLFAERALKQGEAVLVERPLLVTPVGSDLESPPEYTPAQHNQHVLNELERGVEMLLSRMEEKHRAAFLELYNSHTDDGSGPLVGRIRTNAVGIGGLTPGDDELSGHYSATCEFISRINHSCSPNTSPKFDKATFSFTLYATRDIPKDEELTFQFVDVTVSRLERNKALRPYGFQCDCAACKNPASNRRRTSLGKMIPRISICDWALDDTLSDDWFLEKSRAVIEMLETEGMEYVEYYYISVSAMMQLYICLGDAERTSEWAKRVQAITWMYEKMVVQFGHGDIPLAELADPKSGACQRHPLWRARVDRAPRLKSLDQLAGPEGKRMLEKLPPGSELEAKFLKQFALLLKEKKAAK
ncbi:Aldehyde dehydrogenase [Mycena kentingensis (nom. inval.)]|nr:Aldehyde dehydrogenase [Mycena kentingensis (nom. inval.)]